MTINAPAAVLLLLYQLVAAEQGVDGAKLDRHDPERRAQGVHRPWHLHLPAEGVAAADRGHLRATAATSCRAGTPSPSRATTWPRPARRPRRRSRSPWPTRRSTCGRRRRRAWAWTTSRRGCPSSSSPARRCSRRSPSSGRPGGSGPGSCATSSASRNPKSQMLRFHTQTAGVQLTAQQPEVNLVRVALQGLGAVLGGTQSLHTNSYDEAIALPTAKAARLALRTQQVLAYETDVTKTVDPFAGLVRRRVAHRRPRGRDRASAAGRRGPRRSRRRDRAGLPEGRDRAGRLPDRPGDRHRRAGRRRRQQVHRRRAEAYEPLRVDPAIEADQREALARLRDAAPPAPSSGPSTSCGRRPGAARNVLVPMRAALTAEATVGEVCHALRDVWGTYRPPDRF